MGIFPPGPDGRPELEEEEEAEEVLGALGQVPKGCPRSREDRREGRNRVRVAPTSSAGIY